MGTSRAVNYAYDTDRTFITHTFVTHIIPHHPGRLPQSEDFQNLRLHNMK